MIDNHVSEISIEKSQVNINNLDIDANNILIMTSMKVGTTNFSSSLFANLGLDHHDPIKHNHDLENLETFLEMDKNKLIISCFRNPLKRNLSYFFDTFHQKCYPKTYLCDENDLYKYSYEDIIEHFNKKKFLINNIYNLWYDDFFRITNIKLNYLDKSGVQLFKINKNSYVLLCTLEKYENNIPLLEKFLTFNLNNNKNNVNEKGHIKEYTKQIYNHLKNITLENNYKDEVLNNDLIKSLYDEEEIKSMYN